MTYDEGLAERIREIFDDRRDVTEQRMFGGLAFMIRGHMTVGIVKQDLMVRVGPEVHAGLLRQKHVRPMDFTGKPMTGFLFVGPAGYESDEDLKKWVEHGLAFTSTLSAKV